MELAQTKHESRIILDSSVKATKFLDSISRNSEKSRHTFGAGLVHFHKFLLYNWANISSERELPLDTIIERLSLSNVGQDGWLCYNY